MAQASSHGLEDRAPLCPVVERWTHQSGDAAQPVPPRLRSRDATSEDPTLGGRAGSEGRGRKGLCVRIAVVNQHPDDAVGGSELQCDLVARGLARRGHEVVYVAVGRRRPGPDGLPYGVVASEADPRALAATLVELQPQAVYWRFNRRGLREVARELRACGIPLVVALAHVDDVTAWPSWPWPAAGSTLRDRASDIRSRFRWRWQLSAYRDVTAIASQRSDLVGRVPLTVVPIQRHVPNIVEPPGRTEPFDHPRPYVAWVANLKPRKRPEMLPALADALAPLGVDLLVAGPVQDDRYAWLAQPLVQHPNLHHLGTLAPDGVIALLASARCLAVTAMPEGFSNVMLQAWWSGTPTVTLDYDPDGLVHREGLGAVADGDVERFHAEVVRFATGPDLSAEAGARARSFARARFAGDDVLDALEALLAAAVGTARVR